MDDFGFAALDHDHDGFVDANTVVAQLRKSQLPDALLSKVWLAANPQSKPVFDRQAFITAMRLATQAAQAEAARRSTGATVALPVAQLMSPTPLQPSPQPSAQATPQGFASFPASTASPNMTATATTAAAGAVKPALRILPAEKAKYAEIFKTLNPENGLVTGEKAKSVLLSSRLPVAKLERIWALSDLNADGKLDVDEFAVAMKLIYSTLNGDIAELPSQLPSELMPSSWNSATAAVAQTPLPTTSAASIPAASPASLARPSPSTPMPSGSHDDFAAISSRSSSTTPVQAALPTTPASVTKPPADTALIAELEGQLAEQKALLASVNERQQLAEQRMQTATAQVADYETFLKEVQAQIEDERKDVLSLEARLQQATSDLSTFTASVTTLEGMLQTLTEQRQRLST